MQKLLVELKNVSVDASQVCCSTSNSLNKEETLSVSSKVLANNNPEVNLRLPVSELKANTLVYVVNKDGSPLMPCKPAKARHLLRDKKAKVVRCNPFTIQLLWDCECNVQPVTLGIDTGFGNIGFSAVSATKELISGVVKLDDKTNERLTSRRMYRRLKRNKLWYREPRFSNRCKPEGWLPPSVERRYLTHLNIINRLKRILPVSEIIIETAKFDIQKIMNPEIQGTEYQEGSLYGYQNMRSYLIAREKGLCQLCGGDFKGKSSHIHHCRQRSETGSDRPENLALLHKNCHIELHKKGLRLSKPKSYKPNIFMSIINKRFQEDLPDIRTAFGYETFIKRNELSLDKTHETDAFVIAGGTIQGRSKPTEVVQVHRNNRVLQLNRKGFKPSIKRDKSKINPKDIFWVEGKQYICKGMFNKGTYVLYGEAKKKEYFNYKKVEKVFHNGSLIWN